MHWPALLPPRALLFNSVCKCAGSRLLFFDPRRLVVAVKDTRTQLCQQSLMWEENKFVWGRVADLSPGFLTGERLPGARQCVRQDD